MTEAKIKTRKAVASLCERLRSEGKRIGFTSGTFDLLHAGHVDYLEKAKAMCDVLVVGVNSDASVRKYKDEGRPIVSEAHRARVVAGLQSVDFVFLFNERRNQKNIERLKPDLYIKAGDYSPEELTSKETVEKYGGEVRLIPLAEDISTTELIRKIRGTGGDETGGWVEEEGAVHMKVHQAKRAPGVFLDRDGTINEEILFLHDPREFKLYPNALEGIKAFQDMGYRIVIISNQPGIGMGYYSKQDFYAVNREMLKAFSKVGIVVDKIYFCPHSKSEGCGCRKPAQALIHRAQRELNLDLNHSVFIGDKTSDMEAGKRAGMKTILVKTGFGGKDQEYGGEPDYWAQDILDAAKMVLERERSEQ